MSEGHILILPEGASREELIATPELYEYIASQGVEWFQYLHDYQKHQREVRVANGGLFLVTGVDKAVKTAVATLWRDEARETMVKFLSSNATVQPREESHENGARYKWKTSYLIRQETKMFSSPFVRGLRIGLSPRTWEEYLPVDIVPFVCPVMVQPTLKASQTSTPSFIKFLPSPMESGGAELKRVSYELYTRLAF